MLAIERQQCYVLPRYLKEYDIVHLESGLCRVRCRLLQHKVCRLQAQMELSCHWHATDCPVMTLSETDALAGRKPPLATKIMLK